MLSENYIRNHFGDIKNYANIIENRLDDTCCTLENVLADNVQILEMAKSCHVNYILIDEKYAIDIDL